MHKNTNKIPTFVTVNDLHHFDWKSLHQERDATPARDYASGIGDAVANRTVNRKIKRTCPNYKTQMTVPRRDDMSLDAEVAAYCKNAGLVISEYKVLKGDSVDVICELDVCGKIETETWSDVADRVATGNAMLAGVDAFPGEYADLVHHLRQASILMSGRHLQHGDSEQPTRNIEVFCNCATSAMSFLTFYLLLNGAGVGRSYDDDMMVVDYNYLPIIVPVIDMSHKDVQSGEIKYIDLRNAKHKYAKIRQHIFTVPDSREGWAKALEKIEYMAFKKEYKNDVLILDFSDVRHRGSPIKGMQNRPASGPGPLMDAISNMASLRDAGMAPWRAAMYADHFLAECVLVGGARRAARMSTKFWRDKSVLDFIEVKRGGFLWSSNNSVTVDQEFWQHVQHAMDGVHSKDPATNELRKHAYAVYTAICKAAYYDGTGEPGLINVDKLVWNENGLEDLLDGKFVESEKFQLDEESFEMSGAIALAWKNSAYKVITNPCGEIVIAAVGGYCLIADVVPFHAGMKGTLSHAEWDADAVDSFRVTTRALIRTNLMDSLYFKEVKRTNRIGVGMTGIHEYAWSRFGFAFRDIIDEEYSKEFWLMLSRFKREVQNEAREYSMHLGVNIPHTDTTEKPAGTTSKLFDLTEGAHLASMREYVRWVQFRNGDPLIEEYRAMGYPIRILQTYSGTTIVGFPTKPQICSLGMGDRLVTAAEATPEEQYQYLHLLEKYWIIGVEEDGVTPLRDTGNQVSYTLKYDPKVVSFEEYMRTFFAGQSSVRCCSVMPQTDTSAYEYQPEQPVTKHEFEMIANAINNTPDSIQEDIGLEHVDCAGGACPVSWNENAA